MNDIPVVILLSVAILILAVCAIGALVMQSTLAKLHFVTPVTSLSVPFFVAAFVVEGGWTVGAGLVVLTGALVAATGPVLEMAIARVAAEAEGIDVGESPQ